MDSVPPITIIIIRSNNNRDLSTDYFLCARQCSQYYNKPIVPNCGLYFIDRETGSKTLSSFNFTTYPQQTGLKIQICVISKTIPANIQGTIFITQRMIPIIFKSSLCQAHWVALSPFILTSTLCKGGCGHPSFTGRLSNLSKAKRVTFLTCIYNPVTPFVENLTHLSQDIFSLLLPKFIFGNNRIDVLPISTRKAKPVIKVLKYIWTNQNLSICLPPLPQSS